MARVIGVPGESAVARGAWLISGVVLILGVLLGGASLVTIVVLSNKMGYVGFTLAVGIVGFWTWRMRDDLINGVAVMREGGDYFKGAVGEVKVADVLAQLPDEFIVFHDFHPRDSDGKRARWNVDHIVVGPTGVFVIDAKNYRGTNVAAAAKSSFAAKNVKQVSRNTMELKKKLELWSAGQLSDLFVVGVVVYAQAGAHTENLWEGNTRTIPLRLLEREIMTHSERAIDQEKAGRIARTLYSQLTPDAQARFKPDFDAYGELSKAARYAARDARVAAREKAELPPENAQDEPPTVCPLCGGKLVRRTARKGDRAGKDFLGCENFRSKGCKYGFNL